MTEEAWRSEQSRLLPDGQVRIVEGIQRPFSLDENRWRLHEAETNTKYS